MASAEPKVFCVTYSKVQVYVLAVKGRPVVRRVADNWVNAIQILRLTDYTDAARQKVLEEEVCTGDHQTIDGGHHMIAGVYIPLEKAKQLAIKHGLYNALQAILEHVPEGDQPPPAPHPTAPPQTALPAKSIPPSKPTAPRKPKAPRKPTGPLTAHRPVDQENHREADPAQQEGGGLPRPGTDATTPSANTVYLTNQGCNRLKMEQWVRDHETIAAVLSQPEATAPTIAPGMGRKLIKESLLNVLKQYPKHRDLQVLIVGNSFRLGSSTEHLTKSQEEFTHHVRTQPAKSELHEFTIQGLSVPTSTNIRTSLANVFKDIIDRIPTPIHRIAEHNMDALVRNAVLATPNFPDSGLPRLGSIVHHTSSTFDISCEAQYFAIDQAGDGQVYFTTYRPKITLSVDEINVDAPVLESTSVFSFDVENQLSEKINNSREERMEPEVSEMQVLRCVAAMKYVVSELFLVYGSRLELENYAYGRWEGWWLRPKECKDDADSRS